MADSRRHGGLSAADLIGDPNAPPESAAWCKSLLYHTIARKRDLQTTVADFRGDMQAVRKNERWRQLHDRDGVLFETWEDFCQYPEPYGLGLSMRQVEAILSEKDDTLTVAAVLGKHGGDRRSERAKQDQVDNINLKTKGGTSAEYLEARLSRDEPELAERVRRGEMSAHAAAREAGFVKKPDAYKQLCKWWREANEEQRAEFEDYIAAWRRRDAA